MNPPTIIKIPPDTLGGVPYTVYYSILIKNKSGGSKYIQDGVPVPSGWEYVEGNDACYRKPIYHREIE